MLPEANITVDCCDASRALLLEYCYKISSVEQRIGKIDAWGSSLLQRDKVDSSQLNIQMLFLFSRRFRNQLLVSSALELVPCFLGIKHWSSHLLLIVTFSQFWQLNLSCVCDETFSY